MFSKLQLSILGGCLLLTTVVFAIFAFRTRSPSRWAEIANSQSADSDERVALPPMPKSNSRSVPRQMPAQTSKAIITHGNEADEKSIDAVMGKFASSFKGGNAAIFIDVMYPPVLEAVGGRKKASEQLAALVAGIKEEEIVNSWKTTKPYLYVAGKSHKYAVIPYEVKINFSGKIITQNSYELGIKTASSWQFVGGDVLTPELYERFFPDFPKDVNLPEVEQTED